MAKFKQQKNKLIMELDTTELSDQQVRLIKQIHTWLAHVCSTESESEYFNSSAELMRLFASAIKQARFGESHKNSSIPYTTQALEFSLDIIGEHIEKQRLIQYDN